VNSVSRPVVRLCDDPFAGDVVRSDALDRALLSRVDDGTAASTLRIFRPGRAVAFGPQDRLAPGYPCALRGAEHAGFAVVERLVGGRAAVYHEGTIAISLTLRDTDARQHIRDHFETCAWLIADALRALGIDARVGPVPGEYCPGAFSVNAGGRTKVAGLAQRVARHATHVGGVVVVSGATTIRDVLDPVYAALGLSWDPSTVGSVAEERPGIDYDTVVQSLLQSFAKAYALQPETLPDEILAVADGAAARAARS